METRGKVLTWLVLGFTTLFYIVLYAVTGNDPFYGDAISTVSRASLHILESNFTSISYPPGLDPGHPITFPLIYALLWKITGTGLWQSHLINMLFSIGILYLLYKWFSNEGRWINGLIAVMVMMCIPQFVSHTAQLNTHLPLTFFALGLALSLKSNKTIHQIFFSSALLLTHLQGLYFLIPIWLWWFFMQDGKSSEKLVRGVKVLLVPIVLFIGWMLYHHNITGWYLSSPDYADHRGLPSFKNIIVNLFLSDWRLIDFGQIALLIVPTIVLFRRRINWKLSHPLILFGLVYLFNALALAVTTKTGPAHRYIFPCLTFLVLANASDFHKVKMKYWAAIIVLLLSGHFWFYPGKTLGDATLAYRSVFNLLDEAKEEFPNKTLYSYAPLGNPSAYTKLDGEWNDRNLLYGIPMDSVSHVLKSNIGGDFSNEEKSELENHWPVRTFEKGYVFVEVYGNPKKVHMDSTNHRKISSTEKWMRELKQTIKGD